MRLKRTERPTIDCGCKLTACKNAKTFYYNNDLVFFVGWADLDALTPFENTASCTNARDTMLALANFVYKLAL